MYQERLVFNYFKNNTNRYLENKPYKSHFICVTPLHSVSKFFQKKIWPPALTNNEKLSLKNDNFRHLNNEYLDFFLPHFAQHEFFDIPKVSYFPQL